MRKVLHAALALALVAGLAGLAGCSKGIRYSPAEMAAFDATTQEHIKDKEVAIGMSQAAVRYSWGAPKAIKSSPGENREVWIYTSARVYVTRLTFVDGRLTESSSGLSLNNPIVKHPEVEAKEAKQSAGDAEKVKE